ncbi:hypothetical protein [Photobacterium sp. GB-210]|uniref:hypothetical protein n=1 Tax=Photobacterium sp. GB-210 TaxID=2022104 RepID=UPI000D16169A|nr:hypothetical protein [Photobacterium sp. GB-210]PSV41057.1 hypothetical protein C9J38_03195 [Photobacterium sp. GB-210]
MAKKKKTTNPYFNMSKSYAEVLNSQIKPDETLFYVRDNLLPILNVKILVKERSREELSDIDLMIFKLIEQGISSINSIVVLTGLAEKLVTKHISEMAGRSFVEMDEGKLLLTELGEETLEHGVPVRIVQRAFRYCAVSEQLLPREAYQLPYTELDSLRSKEFTGKIKSSHILEESQLVNLKGMDLSLIESKRDLGITDEALAFGDIVGYSSGYLQTRLFLVGRNKPERAMVAFGKTCIEYDLKEILATITALKDPNIVRKLGEFNQEQEKKQKLLFGEGEIALDEFGLPIINITKANVEWLSKGVESGQQGILMCGTDHLAAKPIGLKAWGKFSSLSGLTIRYFLREKNLQDDAAKLRKYVEMCDAYMLTPRDEREYPTIAKYVEKTLPSKEIEQLRELAERYSITRISKSLPKQEVVVD